MRNDGHKTFAARSTLCSTGSACRATFKAGGRGATAPCPFHRDWALWRARFQFVLQLFLVRSRLNVEFECPGIEILANGVLASYELVHGRSGFVFHAQGTPQVLLAVLSDKTQPIEVGFALFRSCHSLDFAL